MANISLQSLSFSRISCLIYCLVTLCVWDTLGLVEIVNTTYPLYVRSGDTLTLQCRTNDRTSLRWIQQNDFTHWLDSPLEAGPNVEIETCRLEPSGQSSSKLVWRDVNVRHRGTLTCRGDEQNYMVFLTVLYISARVISKDPLLLVCQISGFDRNPSTMKMGWTKQVNKTFNQQIKADANQLPRDIVSSARYNVTEDLNGLLTWLHIKEPSTLDAGIYNCSFTLGTRTGSVTLSGGLKLDESGLPSAGATSLLLSTKHLTWNTLSLYLIYRYIL